MQSSLVHIEMYCSAVISEEVNVGVCLVECFIGCRPCEIGAGGSTGAPEGSCDKRFRIWRRRVAELFGCGIRLPLGTTMKSYRSINWPGDVLNYTVED